MTADILSAIAPGLVCLGLGLLGTAALRRATRPAPPLPWRPLAPVLRPVAESPESVATRMCRDLALGVCDQVAHVERGAELRAYPVTLVDEDLRQYRMWVLEHDHRQWHTMCRDLDELSRHMASEIRGWREGAEALERDGRTGVPRG